MNPPPSQPDPRHPNLTVIPLTKSRAFTVRSYCEPRYRFLWHFHPEWEIVFNRSGCGTRHVGTSVERFDPGDLVMVPANVPHTFFSSAGQVEEARCTVIHFLPGVWGESFWRLPEIQEFRVLCERAHRGLVFSGPGTAEVGCRMERLAAAEAPSLESLAMLLEIFALIVRLAGRSLHATEDALAARPNPRLEELLDWIGRSLGEPITQHQAAARLKMSPTAFSRWFKTQIGSVFQRHLNEMRIARVCAHLARGDASVTAAAFASGFNNLANFNRRFQEITGLTPSAFRKQFRPGLPASHAKPLTHTQS
ncbi:MAG: AraC family transcriptional regulator [Verrucomicrobia bacterium]|nr:AraC family transcriptional regulator [Verrucomicrobiota bacterium]